MARGNGLMRERIELQLAAVEQQIEVLQISLQELERKKQRLLHSNGAQEEQAVDHTEPLDAGIDFWQEDTGELGYMEEDLESELLSLKQLFAQENGADRPARPRREPKRLLPDALHQYR